MAKKKGPGRQGPKPNLSPAQQLLATIDATLRRGEYLNAVELLDNAQKKYPNQPAFPALLAMAAQDRNDHRRHLQAAMRWVELKPNDAAAHLSLAFVYEDLRYPALTLSTVEHIHRNLKPSPVILEQLARFENEEQFYETLTSEMKSHGSQVRELVFYHDSIQLALVLNQFERACTLANESRRRWPSFQPAWNNLIEGLFYLGKVEEAYQVARQAIELDRHRAYLIGNLSRLALLTGRIAEAQTLGEQLKHTPVVTPYEFTRVCEVFAYLGEDDALVNYFHKNEKFILDLLPSGAAHLFQLVGVAVFRKGDEQRAQKHWRQALKLFPENTLTLNILADLKKPIEERNSPWYFSVSLWLPGVSDYKTTTAFVQARPGVLSLVPMLLDRGDALARQIAVGIASESSDPAVLEALRKFAAGQRGSDQLRYRAAEILNKKHLLTEFRFWQRGEWKEMCLPSGRL